MARRLETGELVDPFGGVRDLARRELRTVAPRSFEDDPLRLLRGLRLVSQLGFDLAGETHARMCAAAPGIAHVSAERIGGGLGADGMGELSRLLLGREPARALRMARDTGVLVAFLPELAPAVGLELGGDRQPAPLDEHLFRVVQNTADAGAPLAVRLAALLHDLGKPLAGANGDHAAEGARVASGVLRRLRYPTRLRRRVTSLVGAHAFRVEGAWEGARARRFLACHGDEAFELVALKEADLDAKNVTEGERDAVRALRAALEGERESPHRIADLAVDGGDLIALGFREGPDIGRVLALLLDDVLEDPSRNRRETLLRRAAEERA
jgi:tRNA nucleotidyltransferase/poly(A) polymerase